MDKVLVEVSVPASETEYDVYLPTDMMFGEATLLVAKMLSDLSGDNYIPSDDCMLFDRITGKLFSPSSTIGDLPIVNGTELVLI